MKNLIPQFTATKEGSSITICADANGLDFMGQPFDINAKMEFYKSLGYTITI
mgnify:CR=1 FL=1